MEFSQFIEILKNPRENLEIEYKEGFNVNDIGKSFAAFATSEGGRIFLGVKKR